MSLPEFFPTNLPQFAASHNRSEFANSVIPADHKLIFCENDKLIMKNPDGSFTEIGGGSGSTPCYKCATVGTGTWTGYVASINPDTGVWTFASTTTSGLTFDKLTPEIGKVYLGNDCIAEVKNFYEGLPGDYIFYMPFSEDYTTEATGKTPVWDVTTSRTMDTYKGINCVNFSGEGGGAYRGTIAYYDFASYLPSDTSPFTMCAWVNTNNRAWIGNGDGPGGTFFGVSFADANIKIQYENDTVYTESFSSSNWYFVVIRYNGTNVDYYVNGALKYQRASSGPRAYTCFNIGALPSGDANHVRFARWRVFSRALTDNEIASLYGELTPTS